MDRTRNGETRYSLADLTEQAGVSVRTVRYYIAEGLLPPPTGSGPASFYGPAHLQRLRLIGRLKDAYLPLKEIRRRLDRVEDRDLPALIGMTDQELFDPATWESQGAPRTVTSYVDRLSRESRSGAFTRLQMAPPDADFGDWPAGVAARMGDLEETATVGDVLYEAALFDEADEAAEKREPESVAWLSEQPAPSAPASMRMAPLPSLREARSLRDVSADRGDLERAAGPAWRRLALGEEIELMVSDRAWRRNREKLEWLANWARKVLR